MLFFRALLAFLILPAVVAGLLPWLLRSYRNPHSSPFTPLGWPVLTLGTFILLWCVRDFYTIGRGTLAPWDPPKKLVIVGLYRFVRNPMYLGVLTILAGWTILTGSGTLLIYTVIAALFFHLRIIFFEEPDLTRLFGPDFSTYCSTVRRWLPTLRRRVK